jgi:hypothetical protein
MSASTGESHATLMKEMCNGIKQKCKEKFRLLCKTVACRSSIRPLQFFNKNVCNGKYFSSDSNSAWFVAQRLDFYSKGNMSFDSGGTRVMC